MCAGVMIWDSSFFYPVLPLFSQKKSGVVIENTKGKGVRGKGGRKRPSTEQRVCDTDM